ncbi:unnamed protein product [Closterium sp. Naga37s-1]|nr:unnamed protein product [Closterium sp. Naga37s-1]
MLSSQKANKGDSGLSDYRTSSTTWIDPSKDLSAAGKVCMKIRGCAKLITGIVDFERLATSELQLVKYDVGQEYKAHYDGRMLPDGTLEARGTFLVYLNDGFEGGETYFPNVGIKVKPERGKAILWYTHLTDQGIEDSSLMAYSSDYPSYAEAVAFWEKCGVLLQMKRYSPIPASAEYPTIAEIFSLWRNRAAKVQEQRRALFFSPAHYPVVDEADSWSTSHADQEEHQAEAQVAEEADSWSTDYEDQEVFQAEAEVAEATYLLFMAAEGDGSEDDSDLSSICSTDAKFFGSETSNTSSGFSDSSCSGQSSKEEPSTAIAVNSLCCRDYRLNCVNGWIESLLLNLLLLLSSSLVSTKVVSSSDLASRMGVFVSLLRILLSDASTAQGLVTRPPAAICKLLPSRIPKPGSTRAAGAAVSVETATLTDSVEGFKGGDGSAAAAESTMQQDPIGGVMCGETTEEGSEAPQSERRQVLVQQQHRVGGRRVGLEVRVPEWGKWRLERWFLFLLELSGKVQHQQHQERSSREELQGWDLERGE